MPLQLKRVPARNGLRWMRDAFALFARRPLAFTSLFAVFLFAALVLSLVPLLGGVLQMAALPLLTLGFMVASRSAQQGGPVTPAQYLEPLRADPARRRSLLVLCALYGAGAVAILLLCDAVSDGALRRLQTLLADPDTPPAAVDALLAEPGVTWGLLTFGVLGTALAVPFWHAPALVHWGAQGVAQSLFSSTLAVWRSRGAFFVYGLAWMALIMVFGLVTAVLFGLLGVRQLAGVAALPAGLLFSTVFYVSLLFTFDDSFGEVGAEARPPAIEG
jgi:hypothetical protein